jgi:hypothetical protein
MTIMVSAQDFINLSGWIADDSTDQRLPFAQIAWPGSNVGTISNEDGKFTISVPSMLSKDSLVVVYMGYVTTKFPVTELLKTKEIILKLKPRHLQLPEFEVISYSPEEVLKQVVAHIPANYGESPVVLTAFIRSQKYVDGTLAEFTESLIEDRKMGYSLYPKKMKEQRIRESNVPFLQKGRVISDTSLVNAMGDIGRNAGCLGCNFIHDFAEFYHETVFDESLFQYYSFRMEELAGENGKVYHLWFDQRKGVKKKLWRGEIWVNAGDFALLKITQKPSFEAFETYEKGKMKEFFYIDNQYSWYKEMPMMEWTTTYSKRSNGYYLNTIRVENWLTFVHAPSGRKTRFSHKNEVVITDATRDPERLKNFKGDKSIGVNQRWDQLVEKSDEAFWKNINYLPVEEKLEKAIRKLAGELVSW